MNMNVLSADGKEIEIREYDEDINDSVRELNLNIEGMEEEESPSRLRKQIVPVSSLPASDEEEDDAIAALADEDVDEVEDDDDEADDFDADALAKALSQRFAKLPLQPDDLGDDDDDDSTAELLTPVDEDDQELSLEQKLAQLGRIIRPRLESNDDAVDTNENDVPAAGKTARKAGRPSKDEDESID